MESATGALATLIPKLSELLKKEYELQKSVKGSINFLKTELECMQAALEKVSSVPVEQLDENTRHWARNVRELSYDIEDSIDKILVRVHSNKQAKPRDTGILGKSLKSLEKIKIRREISYEIKDLKDRLEEVAERRHRYGVGMVVVKPQRSVDTNQRDLYRKVNELVGIDERRDELMMLLSQGHDVSKKNLKIISVVGLGGLGKTTLAKSVYDKYKLEYDCWAFVSVGRNPDVKKVLNDILLEVGKEKYENIHEKRDINEFVDLLREFLDRKRYFIVVDDLWDMQTWETIQMAFVGNKHGSKIIITTRNLNVAIGAGDVYKLQPFSYDNSVRLFYRRIFGGESNHLHTQPKQIIDEVLKKCDGVPLAIITMASLLADKPWEDWDEVYRSTGFDQIENRHIDNTMRILSFSYYDMPPHLKACLLYLSVFPEDYVIEKDRLIWMWIAEGFVQMKPGVGLFEAGETYFMELVNRSMVQPVDIRKKGFVDGCRVHNMVLSLIRSLSCEENHISIVDDERDMPTASNARRLSYQNREIIHIPLMERIRSFFACACDINIMMAPLQGFHLLRVIALEWCHFREGYCLAHLGNLLHLRYLGLTGTYILELPKEVGALRFLQTLNLERTGIEELPSSISLLPHLLCLHGDYFTWASGIIGTLTSLEELRIYPGTANDTKSTKKFVMELGNLRNLRVLETDIGMLDESMEQALLKSLCNLHKLRHLHISARQSSGKALMWEAPFLILHRHLQYLWLSGFEFSSLPTWITSHLLPNLSVLFLSVQSMDFRDMMILGRLPELCYLELNTKSKLVVYGNNGYFPKLRTCLLRTVATVMFRQDKCRAPVMPSLEDLQFDVFVRESKALCADNGHDISFLPTAIGLHNMPSLEKVCVRIYREDATSEEMKEVEEALRHAVNTHPKDFTLEIINLFAYKMITSDQDEQSSINDSPRVFDFHVHVRELNDMGYDFKFTNLGSSPLLQKVTAHLNCEDATHVEVEEALVALRDAITIHPNNPILEVERYSEDKIEPADHDATTEYKEKDDVRDAATTDEEEEVSAEEKATHAILLNH